MESSLLGGMIVSNLDKWTWLMTSTLTIRHRSSSHWLSGPFRICAAAVASVLVLASPAIANDSVGHLAAGGLIFGRTDAIEMKAEDLFISMREVRVRYVFRNRTEADVTTIVAFPLPDVQAPSETNNFVVPNPADPLNFMGFKTRIDGTSVAMQVEQKAFAVGVDRTAMLAEMGLPTSPLSSGIVERLARLPSAKIDQLRSWGMIEFDVYDAGQGMQRHIRPLWSARTIYYWTQTFPAGRDITVEHSYKPSVGGAAQTIVGANYANKDQLQTYQDRYCMTDAFISAARRLQKKSTLGEPVILTEHNIEYILTTGANWAGPIRNFRLTIDKSTADNLVSFCMNGVRKVSPTQFVIDKTDYFPTHNLEILLLKPVRTR
jgi:hypothetical protein